MGRSAPQPSQALFEVLVALTASRRRRRLNYIGGLQPADSAYTTRPPGYPASVDAMQESRRSLPLRQRFAAAASLALIATAITACGGELSEEEYTSQVRDAINPVVDVSQDLATEATQAQSVEDLAPPLGEAESVYSETASTLEDIEPPEDVADLHERLVTAHEEIAETVGEAADAAEDGDDAGVQPFQEAGSSYQMELQALGTEYMDQGYDFGTAATP